MMRQAARLKLWHRCCGLETQGKRDGPQGRAWGGACGGGRGLQGPQLVNGGAWWWMVVDGGLLIGQWLDGCGWFAKLMRLLADLVNYSYDTSPSG